MTPQSDVMTITLNPAVDIATSAPRVEPDRKLACAAPSVDPGGGGVNVARAIARLGGTAEAFVVAAGAAGERLCHLLADERLPIWRFDVPGETRTNLAVTDASTGAQYRFGLPGDPIAPETGEALLAEIAARGRGRGLVVLSGSLPPGLPENFPERIRAALSASGGAEGPRLIVDTSGAPLLDLIAQPVAPLHLLRLDLKESEHAAGRDLSRLADHVAFAESLIARGVAEHLISGRGAEGSLLVSRGMRLLCRPPPLHPVSKIGAGDAFVGALTLSLARGRPLPDALRWGVAAAGATMATAGTGLFAAEDVEALLPQCTVETLA